MTTVYVVIDTRKELIIAIVGLLASFIAPFILLSLVTTWSLLDKIICSLGLFIAFMSIPYNWYKTVKARKEIQAIVKGECYVIPENWRPRGERN